MSNEKKEFEFKRHHRHMGKPITNGLTRLFILWIIKHRGPIHGYGIMKELDLFFETPINKGWQKKSSSSKIYPILKKMERKELIVGEWKTQNNKQVKFYTMTEKGEKILYHVKSVFEELKTNPNWIDFINNMIID